MNYRDNPRLVAMLYGLPDVIRGTGLASTVRNGAGQKNELDQFFHDIHEAIVVAFFTQPQTDGR